MQVGVPIGLDPSPDLLCQCQDHRLGHLQGTLHLHLGDRLPEMPIQNTAHPQREVCFPLYTFLVSLLTNMLS